MNKLTAFLFGRNKPQQPTPPDERNPHYENEAYGPWTTIEVELDEIRDLASMSVPRGNRFSNRQVQKQLPFIWETNDGEMLALRDMATPHLFYTLRMLFNHSVPPAFRIGTFKRRENVDKWPVDYRVQAGLAMKSELSKRSEVEPWMKFEMDDMQANAEFLDNHRSPRENTPLSLLRCQKNLDREQIGVYKTIWS